MIKYRNQLPIKQNLHHSNFEWYENPKTVFMNLLCWSCIWGFIKFDRKKADLCNRMQLPLINHSKYIMISSPRAPCRGHDLYFWALHIFALKPWNRYVSKISWCLWIFKIWQIFWMEYLINISNRMYYLHINLKTSSIS